MYLAAWGTLSLLTSSGGLGCARDSRSVPSTEPSDPATIPRARRRAPRPREVRLSCTEVEVPERRPGRPSPVSIDFDEPAQLGCEHTPEHWWVLKSGDAFLNVPLKGPLEGLHLALQDGVRGRSLAFTVDPRAPERGSMDKVMVELFGRFAHHDEFVQFDERRFIAFDMKLPRRTQAPVARSRMIVWQLWQGLYSPPLRMELDSEDRAAFYLLNDHTGSHPCAATPDCRDLPAEYGGVIQLHVTEPLERDRWHRFVVMVLPRHVGMGERGEVALWVDDVEVGGEVHRSRQWVGYDPAGYASFPDDTVRERGHPNPVFDTSIGIYRSAQRRRQTVLFDRFRVGQRLGEVTGP